MPTGFTPATPPQEVIEYLKPLLTALNQSLARACINAKDHFEKKGWSWDANLAAFEIRKDVLEDLRKLNIEVYDEWDIEKKALCGLLVKTPFAHLKIRKSSDGEVPPAGSAASASFYQWNLLVFPQNDPSEPLPLHLLLLWNDTSERLLDTVLLACVEGDSWRWRESITIEGLSRSSAEDAEKFRQNFYAEDGNIEMEMKPDLSPATAAESPASEEKRDDEDGELQKKA